MHIPYVFGKFSPNFENFIWQHFATFSCFGLVAFSKAVFNLFFTRCWNMSLIHMQLQNLKGETHVTKREGPEFVQHIHCLLQTLPASFCLINLSSTDTYSHLDSNRLIARLLICLYFEDRQTYQHITGHSTAHNVFSHICIKALCISFTRYIHTPTAQACPLKTTNLIVHGVLVPLLHLLSSCSLNLATYQTQWKSKT